MHTRGVPLADDVDLDAIAASTPGMVGADLKNLVNEAALIAARRDHERVEPGDFTDALEKIVLGAERRIMLSPAGARADGLPRVAATPCSGMLQPGADPVRKISIVPRGRALGVTFQAPDDDRYGYGADYLRGRIIGALGGRAAEEIVYGDVTTGAESDLEQVTAHRAADGRALGHVGRDRPGLRAAGAQRRAAALPRHRRRRRLTAHAGAGRRRRCGASSTSATRRRSQLLTANRDELEAAGRGAARARDARRGRRLPRGGHLPRGPGSGIGP